MSARTTAPILPEQADRQSARRTLRSDRLAARAALTAEEHAQRSQQLERRLAGFLAAHWDSVQVIGFYWPYRAEFDVRPLMTRLFERQEGRCFCLPVVIAPGQPLRYRAWQPQCILQCDRHGIATPVNGAWHIPDLLLIPVNAFDDQGYRLGYGAGYFDRTLASLHPVPRTLGIGFELAHVASILPEAHDQPLDAVITECGITHYSGRFATI